MACTIRLHPCSRSPKVWKISNSKREGRKRRDDGECTRHFAARGSSRRRARYCQGGALGPPSRVYLAVGSRDYQILERHHNGNTPRNAALPKTDPFRLEFLVFAPALFATLRALGALARLQRGSKPHLGV